MEAYFDNSATTRVLDSVMDIVTRTMTVDYANPAAKHIRGMEAENYIRDARSIIAKTLKVADKEILFTSGGSESNNMALIGTAMANKRAGMHIISTNVEHASIYNTLGFLQEQGFEITYLPVDHNGHIDLDQLREAVRPDTILVSVMYVNNEVGSVEPVAEISRVIKAKNPSTIFHVDAIQAYGKYEIRPKKEGIDLLSVSGHKIHGPKGSGFLFVRDKVKVHPLILGGGQERGLRSGTENVPAIAGLGQAAMEIYQNFDAKIMQMYRLRDYFIAEVEKIDGVSVNGHKDHSNAPHIVSVSVSGVRSEVLLHALEDREIYVSAGSACSSNKPAVSRTLQSIGLKRELLESTVRFSFSVHTTKEEIDYALEAMAELVPMLAKYRRS